MHGLAADPASGSLTTVCSGRRVAFDCAGYDNYCRWIGLFLAEIRAWHYCDPTNQDGANPGE